jgi:hypothetical protein
MPKHKKAPSAGKKVALKESGHKANSEGKKMPMAGAGPDEKVKAMHEKQKHAPASMAHEKPSIPYGKHPMNKPAGPHKHVKKKKA